ncbi:MAG TPA: hypothetical protein VMV42_01310 [archaeon]|nr:hypothetical protein [archaeon]
MSIEKAVKKLEKARADLKAETRKRDAVLKKYTKRMAKNMHEAMTQEKDRAETAQAAALNKFEDAKKAVFAAVETKVATIEKNLKAEKKEVEVKVKKVKKAVEAKVEKKK